MNPFILSPDELMKDWRQFRTSLPKFSEEEQLQKVAEYWALAPLAKYSYEMDQPESWPSPWEMIADNTWCKNSVAIGMEFTLRLSGWDASRLEIANILDYDLSDQLWILIIDGQKVLNYNYADVVDYPNTKHDVVDRLRFSGKFYSRLVL